MIHWNWNHGEVSYFVWGIEWYFWNGVNSIIDRGSNLEGQFLNGLGCLTLNTLIATENQHFEAGKQETRFLYVRKIFDGKRSPEKDVTSLNEAGKPSHSMEFSMWQQHPNSKCSNFEMYRPFKAEHFASNVLVVHRKLLVSWKMGFDERSLLKWCFLPICVSALMVAYCRRLITFFW